MKNNKKKIINGSSELFTVLRQEIYNGGITGKLPSIAEFTRQYRLGSCTVKKALDQLKHDGIIYGIQGKGFFVNEFMNNHDAQAKVMIFISIGMLYNHFYLRLLSDLRNLFAKEHIRFDVITEIEHVNVEGYDAVILVENILRGEDLEIICHRIGTDKVVFVHNHKENYFNVGVAEKTAGYKPIEYLYKMGHRKIGVLSRDLELPLNFFHERYQGVLEFKKQHKDLELHAVNIGNISQCALEKSIHEHTAKLLHEAPEITAIFTFTDQIALCLYAELQIRKIRIPDDISIISYDNRDFSALVNPALSSFDGNAVETSGQLFQLCRKIIFHKAGTPEFISPDPILFERSSVKKI